MSEASQSMNDYKANGLLILVYFGIPVLTFICTFSLGLVGSIFGLVLMLVGSYMVYQDAINLGLNEMPQVWSPIIWAIVVFFFWMIALAAYLLKRRGYFYQRILYQRGIT